MADITKEELKKEIAKILKDANLATTSTKKVIHKLEKIFKEDLSDKKKIIDQLVMKYVNSKNSDSENEYEEDDVDEEEEEEEKKPVKRAAPASKASAKKSRKESSDEDDDDDDDKGSDESESEEEKKKKPAAKKGKKKKGSDGDSDSDWGKKKEKAPKARKAGGGGKGSKGGGYTRAYKLSPALAELMGQEEMPRHEVVKRVWALVKERKLYDPNNRQFAICDDAMYKVFGTKRFRIFGMMKHLKTHFCD